MKNLITFLFVLILFFSILPQNSFSQNEKMEEKKNTEKIKSGIQIVNDFGNIPISPIRLHTMQECYTDAALPYEKKEGIKDQVITPGIFNDVKAVYNIQKSDVQSDEPTATNTFSGTTTPNWNNTARWSLGHIPLSTEDVVITSNCTVNITPVSGFSLTVNSGVTLTVLGTAGLTIGTGGVTNNGSIVLNAGNSTTTTYLFNAGNFTNSGTGTFNGTAAYTMLYFNGTTAQSLINNGTVTAPLTGLTLANTTSGLTLSGSNQIVCGRVNLYYGTMTNSNKITLGNGGTTTAAIQIGANSAYAAGSFDQAPSFNAGTGGVQLLYSTALSNYSTSYEVPSDGIVSYFLLICTPRTLTLSRDVTIPYVYVTGLNLSSGNLSIGAHTLTIDGVIGVTSGTITGSTSSNITLSGTESITIPAVTGGLNNFTINNSDGVKMGGAVTVNGTLILTNGYLINTSNLTMANGSTISRSAGSLITAPTYAGTVNLIYTGGSSITTAKELPTGNSVINDLVINSGGTVQGGIPTGTVSTLYSNGFNSVPADWTGEYYNPGGPVPTMSLVNTGTSSHPGVTPSEGLYCLEFNSYNCNSGSLYRYKKSSSPLVTTGKTNITVVCDWYRDNTYTNMDNVRIQWSTDGTTWNDSFNFYRYNTANGWVTVDCLLPAGAENQSALYVALFFTSDYGNNCHLDNFKVNVTTPGTPTPSACTINGTLYLTGNYTPGSGNTLSLANNATINRSDGSLSAAPSFGTYVNLIYSGTNAVTTGVENPGTGINNFTVNNSSASGVTLGTNTQVNGTLTMTSGNIITGANILSIGTSTSSLGALVRTSGSVIGNCKRWFAASTLSNVVLPVGVSDNYRPATISFTGAPSTGGSLTAKFVASDPGSVSAAPFDDVPTYTINTYCTTGYWQIDAGDALAGGIYTLKLTGTGFNVDHYNLIHILKRSDAASNWGVPGTHVAGSGSNAVPEANRTGLSGFSQFVFGSNTADNPFNGALPVELASFTSNVNGRNTKLLWETASKFDNAGFDVERKVLNSEWMKIGFVQGNGYIPTKYSFEDRNLQTGKYSYRLKQIDVNGNYEYHNLNGEVEIGVPSKFSLSQNYPNPFNPVTKIDFDLPSDSRVHLVIFDITGRELMTLVNEVKTAGYYTYQFNAGSLSSGVYFYRIEAIGGNNNYLMTKKMTLVK